MFCHSKQPLRYRETTNWRSWVQIPPGPFLSCCTTTVAPEFTKYQQYAIGFKDLGIQLWEVEKYKNNIVIFNEVKPFEATESISTIAKTTNPQVQKISREIKVYTESDLLKVCNDETKDLYNDLKNQILSLGNDIEIRPTKKYVAFRRKQQFVGIVFLKEKLKVYLNVDSS